jgi:quinol monooxygenase YgiN
MTQSLSEFYSDPKSGLNRMSKVSASLSGTVYIIEMFEDEKLIHSHTVSDHTLEYAEDCAENWVLGVIKE